MPTRAAFVILVIIALGSIALAQQHAPATGSPTASPAPTATTASSSGTDAGALHTADAAAAVAAPTTSTFDIPMIQRGSGAVTHFPIPEQLARNDIPVFVQVRSSAPIDHVDLFFRSQGAPRYSQVRMERMGQDQALADGYGAVIPCEDAFPPAVEYYVQALATSGDAVGSAGSNLEPVRLPIVMHRAYDFVPTLPGQGAPRDCGGIRVAAPDPAHAPGAGHAPEGAGTADLGDPCTHNSDCHHGLRCGTNHLCVFIRAQ